MSNAQTIEGLSNAEVRDIRKRFARKESTQRKLATEYGLKPSHVKKITEGAERKSAGGPIRRKGRTRLSAREIVTLRRRYADGVASQVHLAREYGVSPAAVSRLVRGETHPEVGGPLTEKGGMPHGHKLTPRQILEAADSSESASALARQYGVSRQAIQAIRRRWGSS